MLALRDVLVAFYNSTKSTKSAYDMDKDMDNLATETEERGRRGYELATETEERGRRGYELARANRKEGYRTGGQHHRGPLQLGAGSSTSGHQGALPGSSLSTAPPLSARAVHRGRLTAKVRLAPSPALASG
ncbi:unnamed protein product [Amoebophrya sp. A120]|nr:unnamed protein product [Amoebophrya sp. A120]|eukprot:GSA120T00017302001.1